MSGRYDAKPFLRLLECYVLWSADQLSEPQAALLEQMTPSLSSTYGFDGAWHSIVAAEMSFPVDLPHLLRQMWESTLVNAGGQRGKVDAQLWAEQVVDSNFT